MHAPTSWLMLQSWVEFVHTQPYLETITLWQTQDESGDDDEQGDREEALRGVEAQRLSTSRIMLEHEWMKCEQLLQSRTAQCNELESALQAAQERVKVLEEKLDGQGIGMQQVGFVEVLQITYVELAPNSVIPIHRDDCHYFSGKHIIEGPSQLWLRIAGDHKQVQFKFKNVGMIDVSKPVFINNMDFVHSLVYSGDKPRGVLLVTGISTLTNKHLINE